MSTAKAPSNYKDPEKIRDYIAKARDELARDSHTIPLLGQLTGIAVRAFRGKDTTHAVGGPLLAARRLMQILTEAYEDCGDETWELKIVGFNAIAAVNLAVAELTAAGEDPMPGCDWATNIQEIRDSCVDPLSLLKIPAATREKLSEEGILREFGIDLTARPPGYAAEEPPVCVREAYLVQLLAERMHIL